MTTTQELALQPERQWTWIENCISINSQTQITYEKSLYF